MSFGFSPSDVITLIALTKKAYDGWRSAGTEYADLVQTLSAFRTVLKHVSRRLEEEEHLARRRKEMESILKGCQDAVQELRDLSRRYRSLTHIDRLRLGTKDISGPKERLVRHMSMLTPFLLSVELESIGKDVQSLHSIMDRIPGIIMNALPVAFGNMIDTRANDVRSTRSSVLSSYGEDDKQAYKELRRELWHLGVRDSEIRRHQAKLISFMQSVVTEEHVPAEIGGIEGRESRSADQCPAEPRVAKDHQSTSHANQNEASKDANTPARHAASATPVMEATARRAANLRLFQAYVESDHDDEVPSGSESEMAVDGPLLEEADLRMDSASSNKDKESAINPANANDAAGDAHVSPSNSIPEEDDVQNAKSAQSEAVELWGSRTDEAGGSASDSHVGPKRQMKLDTTKQCNKGAITKSKIGPNDGDSRSFSSSSSCSWSLMSDEADADPGEDDFKKGGEQDQPGHMPDGVAEWLSSASPHKKAPLIGHGSSQPVSSHEVEAPLQPEMVNGRLLLTYEPLQWSVEQRLTVLLPLPLGWSVYVEKDRIVQFENYLAPRESRRFYPEPPALERSTDYSLRCGLGFPSACNFTSKHDATSVKCKCDVLQWSSTLDLWNPGLLSRLRKWASEASSSTNQAEEAPTARDIEVGKGYEPAANDLEEPTPFPPGFQKDRKPYRSSPNQGPSSDTSQSAPCSDDESTKAHAQSSRPVSPANCGDGFYGVPTNSYTWYPSAPMPPPPPLCSWSYRSEKPSHYASPPLAGEASGDSFSPSMGAGSGPQPFHSSTGGKEDFGRFQFGDPKDIFAEFMRTGGASLGDDDIYAQFGGSGVADPKREPESERTVVEKPLHVSLEDIFTGATKKLKVQRKTFDRLTGKVDVEDKILSIPLRRGILAGSKIKYLDMGDRREGSTQDLHFIVKEKLHPRFVRMGKDLQSTVDITLDEARNGWERTVETIDRKRVLVSHKGPTPSTWEERFPELGMPSRKGKGRGDLVVGVRITV